MPNKEENDPPSATLIAVLELAAESGFSQIRLAPQTDTFVEMLTSACPNEEATGCMLQRVESIVRRFRLPGYFLAFWMQLVTQRMKSPFHIIACRLYSDAQTHFASSLAIHSLELAYTSLLALIKERGEDAIRPVAILLTRSQIPEMTSVQSIEGLYAAEQRMKRSQDEPGAFLYDHILSRIRSYYNFYRRWCRAFAYSDSNPLTENHFWYRTIDELRLLHPIETMRKSQPGGLLFLIEQLSSPEHLLSRIAARRLLATVCQADDNLDVAIQQYRLGLNEANESHVDTEIGHMRRGLGFALYKAGRLEEALDQFEMALRLELSHQAMSYWAALTAAELGNSYLALASGSLDSEKGKALLLRGVNTYRDARILLEKTLVDEVIPIDRAVKQQLFRCYQANAMSAAVVSQSMRNVLMYIEANGPLEAGDLMAEMTAAHAIPVEVDFRKSYAVFQRHLASFPDSFEEYLKSIVEDYKMRNSYLRARSGRELTDSVRAKQNLETAVTQFLDANLQGVMVLAMDVGWEVSTFVLIDPERRSIIALARGSLGEQDVRRIHSTYMAALTTAGNLTGIAHDRAMRTAIDSLLREYECQLGGVLEKFIPLLAGKQLKILPRLAMNAVPWQALMFNNKCLIDHCDVSYAPSLRALVDAHKNGHVAASSNLLMVHDDLTTPCFKGTAAGLIATYGDQLSILRRPTWDTFVETGERTSGELFLACHGMHDPYMPTASCVWFDRRSGSPVTFAQFLSEFPSSRFDSIVLGACESGLARAEVAAEYIGLPLVFLACGVRYVVSSLWQAHQLATAVLLDRYFTKRYSGNKSSAALCAAQREVSAMTRADVAKWIDVHPFPQDDMLLHALERMDEVPFSHPYFWAAFQVSGDV